MLRIQKNIYKKNQQIRYTYYYSIINDKNNKTRIIWTRNGSVENTL